MPEGQLPAREAMEFDVVIVGAAGRACRRNKAQAALARDHRGGRGERLGGRRPHPFRRGD